MAPIYCQGLSNTLIHWLHKSPFVDLISADRYIKLEALSKKIDTGLTGPRANQTMGIEVHHDNPGKADFGIGGDLRLTAIAGISYPIWVQQWFTRVKAKGLEKAFPQQFWLEFDDNGNGYQLMGLFQQCDPSVCEASTLTELFLEQSDEEGFLESTLKQIGMPDWIGLIDRWQEHLKLVIPLHDHFNEPLTRLLEQWFNPQLSSINLTSKTVVDALKSWTDNGLIRLSVDCKLSQDLPGRRICFELFKRQHESDSSHKPEVFHRLLEQLHIPADQIFRFQQLRNRLPHANKRPSFNLIDDDYFVLAASHAKICFGTDGINLKDYLWLSGGHREQDTDHSSFA